jgi:hypothetical protein
VQPVGTRSRKTSAYLACAYAPALSGKQGSVLLGDIGLLYEICGIGFFKSVCCMTYLIKNLNIYKNLGLWNSILFSVLQNKEFW